MREQAAAGLVALRGLHRVLTRVSGLRDLDATLQAVVDGVVEGVGFGVAAVNCVRSDGSFEMRAVAGSEEARAALVGVISPPDAFEEEFAVADRWGGLRFVPHGRLQGDVQGWVPSVEGPASPDGWHPEDALFAPLHAASGDLVGVLSVDLPHDGRRPGALQRELLEMFAAQAGIAIDNARLTEQLRLDHERLRASEESLSLAFEGSDVGMAMIEVGSGATGRFLRVNRALAEMTGYSVAELTALRVADLSHPDDLALNRNGLNAAISAERDVFRMESRYLRADGAVLWVAVTSSIVRGSGGDILYGFIQAQDITQRRASEQRLARAATRDPLTGLANRAALDEHLTAALAGAGATRRPGAVVFCDLDGFKAVNDSLGHAAGDAVLVAVAGRLQGAVRDGDLVARLGGDEFVLLVQGIEAGPLVSLLDRLLELLAEPVQYGERALRVTASLGVALLDGEERDAASVLRRADTAMYQAKNGGRNQYAFLDRTALAAGG